MTIQTAYDLIISAEERADSAAIRRTPALRHLAQVGSRSRRKSGQFSGVCGSESPERRNEFGNRRSRIQRGQSFAPLVGIRRPPVSVTALPLSAQQAMSNIRLRPHAVATPALSSQVRPAMVLQERDARRLLEAAERFDVSRGGNFAAGPAGIQVWTGPFDGPNGSHGTAHHLGSVDWSYDTPVKHYVTIYRVMVTQAGVDEGETTFSILQRVLGLGGLAADGNRITLPMPPARDPFRRMASA
jgi:hypothetical protein